MKKVHQSSSKQFYIILIIIIFWVFQLILINNLPWIERCYEDICPLTQYIDINGATLFFFLMQIPISIFSLLIPALLERSKELLKISAITIIVNVVIVGVLFMFFTYYIPILPSIYIPIGNFWH